jgi:predicted PurR-regulated permease PerM
MNDNRVLDISWETILKVSLSLFCFYIIYLVRDILFSFFFALIISILFEPAINFLRRFRIPRVLSVIFIYIIVFGVIGLMIYSIAPTFITEIQQFSQMFPQYFDKVAPSLRGLGVEAFENMDTFVKAIGDNLQKISSSILNAVSALFGGIGSMLFILTIAFFLSLEGEGIEKVIKVLVPKRYEDYALFVWQRSQTKVSGWFGSRLLMCIFVGTAFFITLLLFNTKYALSLSLLAGILNFIPFLGPIMVSVISFVFIGLDSWLKGFFAVVAFVLIQQVENNILSPVLTKKFVGISPVLVLIALAIGAKLAGIMGAILAIPLAGIISEFLRDFIAKRKEEKPAEI